MSTLLNPKPMKLEDAISWLQSPPEIAPITVCMEQSPRFLNKYIPEAAQKCLGASGPRSCSHSPAFFDNDGVKRRKPGNTILLDLAFQDEMFCGVILRNFTDILSGRDDRYVALGWCIPGCRLVEYENVVGNVLTNAIWEKQRVVSEQIHSRSSTKMGASGPRSCSHSTAFFDNDIVKMRKPR